MSWSKRISQSVASLVSEGKGQPTGLVHEDQVTLVEYELQASMDTAVASALQKILPGLIVIWLVDILYNLIASQSNLSLTVTFVNLLGVTACGWLAVQIRSQPALPFSAHRLGAAVAGLVILRTLAHVYLASEAHQVMVLVLLLMGGAYIFLSLPWLLVLHTAAVGAWTVTASFALAGPVWKPLTLLLLAAAGLSGAICHRRIDVFRQQHKLRLEEKQRQRKAIERRRREEERNKLAIEAASDGHWYWDLSADQIFLSPQWAAMLGYDQSELTTEPDEWFNRVHPYYLPELKEALSSHLYGKSDGFQCEYRIQHRDGTYVWVLSRGLALRDTEGNPTAIAGSQTNISHLMEAEKRRMDDAFHDKLTGLPNRHALMVRLERAFERARRSRTFTFALMFLDLDRFKLINDSLGHLVGDQLLAAVAARLRGCVRQRGGDIVGRFGGDEFVVLLEELRQPEDDALLIAKRIQGVLSQPFKLGEHEIATGASIGIAFGNWNLERPEDLLRNADTAMYSAKSQRKGKIEVFNAQMHSEVMRLHQLQNDLGRALERQEMILHYQPVISFESGRIVGAEALLRWQHSSTQMIGPSEFVPLAEETGLIVPIGEWVLRTACAENAVWCAAGFPRMKVAVNVSAHQLRVDDFPQMVARILTETRLDPTLLELELTETALMDNRGTVADTMKRLSHGGISMSIDDFGTGYSSLSYLKSFPFNSLKMDRSFVAGLTSDEKSAAVAKGLIHLAHNLKLKVIAEGVESQEQAALLRQWGCDRMQGYLASRPVEATQFVELLRSEFNLYRLVGEIPLPTHLTPLPEARVM